MISVVVPVLNEEKLIAECLKSLRNQDYKGEYEIVVVDNGSTDKTASIARDFGARVVSCSQMGVTRARHAGAEAALGDIIVQADADTVYPGDWLSRIERHFVSHPKAVAVAGAFIYKSPPWWARIEYFLRMLVNLLSGRLFGRPFIISGANFAFYKRAWSQAGGYDPDSYSSDQYDVSVKLGRLGKIIYDSRLQVRTSNRAVQKPLFAIATAFVLHIVRFLANASGVFGIALRKSVARVRAPALRTYLPITLPVMLVGIISYGYFVPASPVFGKVYYKSVTSEKVIALSFDDGPNEPYTSQILDILAEYDVKATFFVIGRNVELYPETARRIVAEGHVLGNHSYNHNANHALPLDGGVDLGLAQQAIFAAAGVLPHLYRPPHGKKSPWELWMVRKLGLITVLWSDSTNELSKKPNGQLAREIIRKAQPGSIILLHDGYGTQHNSAKSDKSRTVEMLPAVIEKLQADGYRFVTIPQLLNVPAYNQASK